MFLSSRLPLTGLCVCLALGPHSYNDRKKDLTSEKQVLQLSYLAVLDSLHCHINCRICSLNSSLNLPEFIFPYLKFNFLIFYRRIVDLQCCISSRWNSQQREFLFFSYCSCPVSFWGNPTNCFGFFLNIYANCNNNLRMANIKPKSGVTSGEESKKRGPSGRHGCVKCILNAFLLYKDLW